MLIEQTIEFQLRGPGPPGRTCTSITVIFMIKQKSPSRIFEGILFTAIILLEAMFFTSPLHRLNHLLLKFYTIMQDFKRVFGIRLQVKGGSNN